MVGYQVLVGFRFYVQKQRLCEQRNAGGSMVGGEVLAMRTRHLPRESLSSQKKKKKGKLQCPAQRA